jgi:hypothetical protein
MRAACGVYPRLGRYFKSASELAFAAVMTRPTLLQVLNGQREFTKAEKTALCNYLYRQENDLNKQDLKADSFDELFKQKE